MAFEIPRVPVPRVGGGARRLRVVWLLGATVLIVGTSFSSCTTYVHPGEAGVKQIKYGPGKGIEPFVYGVGLHYVGVGETMHRFPTSLQVLELTNSSSEAGGAAEGHLAAPAINIQTSEGYKVTVDATVLYRISDPLRVMSTIGPERLFEQSAVIPRSNQNLRRSLGELDTEDFYRGTLRMEKAAEAKRTLQTELKEKGIQVLEVFVRKYVYDDKYQNAIEARKIQDQTVFKNEAEAKAATAAAAKNKIVAEGAAAVQVQLSKGDAEVKKLEAEADLYRRRRAADGDLLVKLAEATGTELENQALRGVGSENLVGLRMADALKGTQVIILPSDGEGGMNPLDLRALLKRFDVKEK